jgi:hypothetical protein
VFVPAQTITGEARARRAAREAVTSVRQIGGESHKSDQVALRAELREGYWAWRGDQARANQQSDSAENVTGELHAGNVSSGGTTTEELDFALQYRRLYELRVELRYVAGEALTAGSQPAVTGALVGGGISTIKQGVLVARGDMSSSTSRDARSMSVRRSPSGSCRMAARSWSRVGAAMRVHVTPAVSGGDASSNRELGRRARGGGDLGVTRFEPAMASRSSSRAGGRRTTGFTVPD